MRLAAVRLPSILSTLALTTTLTSAASAQWYPPPPYAPYPPPQAAPPPPPNVTQGPGSVTVTETPAGPVDVHAQTASGTVHAYACRRVDVDRRTPSPPVYPAAQPVYPAAPPCPAYYVPYPVYSPYAAPLYYLPPRPKPKYAPDPARRSAILVSSLLFGIGTVAAGGAYVTANRDARGHCALAGSCRPFGAKAAMFALGAFETFPASVPRYVVGDVGMGLLFTGLRGTSFAVGSLIDFKDKSYVLPVTLAVVAPITLSIVELATTPHREQLRPRPAKHAASSFRLQGLGPTVTADKDGNLVPAFGASGTL
jgi:hypothetical protein